MRRHLLLLSILFVLFTSTGVANIYTKLNELEALVNQLVTTPQHRQDFEDFMGYVRDHVETLHYSTIESALDAFLGEVASLMLNDELSSSGQSPMQDGEDLIEAIAEKIDEIKAEELFFKADDLVRMPYENFYLGSISCSVTILARTIGPIMFDPGGELYLRFGESAELEAVGGEPGGTFVWSWVEEGNHNDFYSSGARAYFRAVEFETASVRVTHTTPMGGKCQAVLRVFMQGGLWFPD